MLLDHEFTPIYAYEALAQKTKQNLCQLSQWAASRVLCIQYLTLGSQIYVTMTLCHQGCLL